MYGETADALPTADLALVDGRVIDPETGADSIATVRVRQGRIVSIGRTEPRARVVLDCVGQVVTPGFIDLHSHAQTLNGSRLQALDGVTTAVDLEAGALALPLRYAAMAAEGRAVNYGYAAGWAATRAAVLTGVDPAQSPSEPGFAAFQAASAVAGWTRPALRTEVDAILTLLDAALTDGALGIGALLGYVPDSEPSEFERVVRLAASRGVGTFTHSRSSATHGEPSALTAVEELIRVAETVGGHVHLCHLNSTSGDAVRQILTQFERARGRGVSITTEVYPYARGSTVIGAAFLSPEELRRDGRLPSSLIYAPTGETIVDDTRLGELRELNPGAVVLTLSFDESNQDERNDLDRVLTLREAAFASDAMPAQDPAGGDVASGWPMASSAFAHPRSAGCFSRVFRWLVRERQVLSLTEAIRRCTVVPADILAPTAPAMCRKGRVQPGMDADLVVFDPATITDHATYTLLAPSTGVRHLLVGGVPVVRDGELLTGSRPGEPILGRCRADIGDCA